MSSWGWVILFQGTAVGATKVDLIIDNWWEGSWGGCDG